MFGFDVRVGGVRLCLRALSLLALDHSSQNLVRNQVHLPHI